MDASSARRAALARWTRPSLLAVAAILMIAHCLRFRDFTVDDAAISFAYSQNFAHGHGLVATAGGERVEGYSNFLWVVLVGVVVAVFGHIMVVAKVLGLVLAVAITVGAAELLAALRRRRSALDALPAFLCAGFTPIPYWSMSGLENPLFLALTIWCCVRLVREADDAALRPWSALLAALVALTRPDGLIIAAAAAATQLLSRHQVRRLPRWLLVAGAPIAAHILWRYSYYAYPWPNTYYVKVAFPFKARELLDRHSRGWTYLLAFCDRYRLTPLLLLTPLALVARPVRARLAIFAVLAAVLFFPIYARGDWMSEGRFAVGAMPLLLVLAVDGVLNLAHLARRLPGGARTAAAFGGVLMIALVCSVIPKSLEISAARAHHYPVPVEYVAQRARRYQDLARALEGQHPSVADGDAGGNLMYAGMPLVDIGWLTDGTLSHWGRNPGFVREYIYRERRPTFMRLTGYWLQTHLQDYDEFQEYVNAPAEGSGLYVARSAFTVEGIDTRAPIAHLTDVVDVIGTELTPTEVRAWLLARVDHPAVRLWLRTPKAEAALVPGQGIYGPTQWRAGEVIKVHLPRPAGADLNLCADQTCVALADGRRGAAPVSLPVPSDAAVRRLRDRGELEAALAALRRAGEATDSLAGELYRRGLRSLAAGETGAAFSDFEETLRADPSRSFARRHLEELRPAPRGGYHPLLALRVPAAVRDFQLAPTATRLATLVALAQRAGEPERAVRAHWATRIAPADAESAIALAECYLAVGLPDEAARLLPERAADEEQRARMERIALAAGRRDLFERLQSQAPPAGTAVAPDLELAAASARLDASGATLLDLVFRRGSARAPSTIRIDGRTHTFRRPPSRWVDGEHVLETVVLPPSEGSSTVSIGAASIRLDAQPFTADFERERLDGWKAAGTAFDQQPKTQEWHEGFGTQGNRYLYSGEWGQGSLTSPTLSSAVADVCLLEAGAAENAVRLESSATTIEARGAGSVARATCLHRPPNAADAHIVIDDESQTSRIIADEFTCFTTAGAPTSCAGSVTASIRPQP